MSEPSGHRVTTSENVGIAYRTAGLATRIAAATIDYLIIFIILLVVLFFMAALIAATIGSSPSAGQADSTATVLGVLYISLVFFIIIGYFTIAEVVTGGKTPGKSAFGLRVIRIQGGAPQLWECFARNILLVVDLMGVGPILMFFQSQGRRLGDFAAGTLVVNEKIPITFQSTTTPPPVMLHSFDPGPPLPGLGELGERDFAAVRTLLARPGLDAGVRHQLAQKIAAKLFSRMQLPPGSPEWMLPPEITLERIYLQLVPRFGA